MSLKTDEVESDQNEMALLHKQLTDTNALVKTLSSTLQDMQHKVIMDTYVLDLTSNHNEHFKDFDIHIIYYGMLCI